MHVTSTPYIELGWPSAQGRVPCTYPNLFSEHNPWASSWQLSLVWRSIFHLLIDLFIGHSKVSRYTGVTWEGRSSWSDTKVCGTGALTSAWKLTLESHGQKVELGKVLDCSNQGPWSALWIRVTVVKFSIKLAWTHLLKALLLLYCFIELTLHKFWLQRSRVLKAEGSGVRGISEHLCWIRWDNT